MASVDRVLVERGPGAGAGAGRADRPGGGPGGLGGRSGLDSRLAELVEMARSCGVPVSRVAKGECDVLAGVRAQGIAAEVTYAYADYDGLLASTAHGPKAPKLLLFLDGIEDPHNLGAILRTAAAAAVAAVVIPQRRSVQVGPAVVRVSAGTAVAVPVCRVTNLVRAMDAAREAGFWLVGLAGDGPGLLSAGAADGRYGLVVGGEGRGLRRLVAEACDEVARLPMPGGVESLNASVAAAVAIYRLCETALYR